jgi:YbbR domain-containing protein
MGAGMLSNWHLKLISLIIGSCLWYFVAGEDQVDMTILVPLEVLNLPADLIISNQYKKDIEVTVRGPRRMIQNLRNQNITRPVDLSRAQPGTEVIKNTASSISLPKGIGVLRLQPTSITLLLDELIEKTFPINPVTDGEVADGYFLSELTLSPDELTITGPRTILESRSALTTTVINLRSLGKSVTLHVNLDLVTAFTRLIGETVVTATMEVQEKMLTITVETIPINVREASIPITTEPESVRVTASVPENLIRDTPEPAMLFRASVTTETPLVDRVLPVTVQSVKVPDHAPISIIEVEPQVVMAIPVQRIQLETLQVEEREDASPTTQQSSAK